MKEYAPVLPAFLKSWVQVCPYDSLIEFRSSDVFHAIQRILVSVVFDEAEAAGSLLEAIKAHY
jgi:hypothetical protein